MPSELSRRLDEFRTKNKVVPAIQKVSFLFDPTRAAGLDVLSLAVIAKKSLFELIKLEPSLSVFEDLFDGTGKSVDFLSQEEHTELKSRISQLLMLLSAHMKSLDCQQCIEFLIQRFHIHVYNGEALILCALPYHDTAMFGSLVKLIPFFKRIDRASPSESRWMFLQNVHKTGSPLSRLALVKMCRSSQPVMTAILEHTTNSLKIGAFNQPLLAFVSTLMMTVLSEFNAIKFDISIMLFSVCRVCFKISTVCPAAYFLGLTLTTSIVCVADIREDALSLLLTRAITSCPSDKLKFVLMALLVVSARRSSPLPESIINSMQSIDSDSLKLAIVELVRSNQSSSIDLETLKSIVPLHSQFIDDQAIVSPQVVVEPLVTAPIESSSTDSSSSESDDEEESEIDKVRRTLVQLITKGSKRDRMNAVAKYAHVEGATRYCIRLAAASDSVESLAIAIKANKSDKGYLGILKSEIVNFSADPKLVLQAAFAADKLMVSPGSIQEVANLLNVPEMASVLAIVKSSEKDFVLSGNVWKIIAVLCAGTKPSPLLNSWGNELVPENFSASCGDITELSNRFVEYANNCESVSSDVASTIGQLMCSIYIPNAQYRKPIAALAGRSFKNLGIEERTEFVAQIVASNTPVLIKKFCQGESFTHSIDAENENLVSAIDSLFASNQMTNDSWTLISRLLSIGASISLSQIVSGHSASSDSCLTGWTCLSTWSQSSSSSSLCTKSDCMRIMNLILDSLDSARSAGVITQLQTTQVETLLSMLQNESVSSCLQSIDDLKCFVSNTIKSCILLHLRFAADTLSDSSIVMLQSVCESVLGLLEFNDAWTLLISTMGTISMQITEGRETVQTLSIILLSSLIGNDSIDPELVTSKELGSLLIGLVDLIPEDMTDAVTPSRDHSIDSWVGTHSLGNAVEQCLVQYLGNCTLKKLDKMFRKLVSQFSDLKSVEKFCTVLRIYSQLCTQGGSAVVLATVGIVRDMILSGLGTASSGVVKKSSKRSRVPQLVCAALEAVAHSSVEELPESYIEEFGQAIAGSIDPEAQQQLSTACVGLAEVSSSDQVKKLVKSLMTQTVAATNDVQECILITVLDMWKKIGDPMVPSITEVTVYIGELVKSKDDSVREAAISLVKEIDRRTGEDIQGKLGITKDRMDDNDDDEDNDEEE